MRIFDIIGILTTLAAIFAYINYRYLKLPVTIGLMLQSLVFSLALMGFMALGVDIVRPTQLLFEKINFNVLFLQGILSFLLFAGALFVKNEELLDVKFSIALFAVAGVIMSAGIIGGAVYGISLLFGLKLRLLYCFLFGALISPTDPVAVLPTLRSLGMPKRVDAQLAGEALFNDGIGITLFLSLMVLAKGEDALGAADVLLMFLRESVGGIAFGAILGWGGYFLIKSVDNYQLEILITLALVSGGYSLAMVTGISGPLAMVVAGLLIGGRGRKFAMSKRTRENLDRFWEVVEELLNSILFTLIGLEVLVISARLTPTHMAVGLAAIPVVLLARYVSIGSLAAVFSRTFTPRTTWVMTWGGLRGGIPIALAISLPNVGERGVFLFATYVVVAFSIIVQGITLKYLVEPP